jgi:hypothetical protein
VQHQHQQPRQARPPWSPPNHNESVLHSSPHGEESTRLLHHQHLSSYSSGLLPDVASLYRTPDLTPHSFPDPYVPVDQFESLNGATSDFSSQWPDPDSSIYSLPFEPLTTQMGYDTSQLETSQELLAHSTEKFDEPIFTTGLGNLLCTSSSPERTSFHSKLWEMLKSIPCLITLRFHHINTKPLPNSIYYPAHSKLYLKIRILNLEISKKWRRRQLTNPKAHPQHTRRSAVPSEAC